MHWILVANGECTLSAEIREQLCSADRIVAVDGGGRHLMAAGVWPHLALGDMDSLPAELLCAYQTHHVPLNLHPAHKDATDLELALELAVQEGATRITFLGMLGGRMDHTLTNLLLLFHCVAQGVAACAMDAGQRVYALKTNLTLSGKAGDLLSLLPLSERLCGVTLRGLEYPLENATLHFGTSRGMSNVFTESHASISVRQGKALVFHLYEK